MCSVTYFFGKRHTHGHHRETEKEIKTELGLCYSKVSARTFKIFFKSLNLQDSVGPVVFAIFNDDRHTETISFYNKRYDCDPNKIKSLLTIKALCEYS